MRALVVVVLILAAIVAASPSYAAERPFGTIGTTVEVEAKAEAKAEPAKVQQQAPAPAPVPVPAPRPKPRIYGSIQVKIGSAKITLGTGGRRDDYCYDDRGYRDDYRRDECRESGLVRIPYCRPDDGIVPGRHCVQFRRDGVIVAEYSVSRVSGDGIYGVPVIDTGKYLRSDDERRIINN